MFMLQELVIAVLETSSREHNQRHNPLVGIFITGLFIAIKVDITYKSE